MSDGPNLTALKQGNSDAWDRAFAWLWPVVFAVAQAKLQPYLPGDVEDVAIEALEELVEAARRVGEVGELRLLAASIAHHRGVSRLREHFAQKRGRGQTTSLEELREDGGGQAEGTAEEPFGLDRLGIAELAALLTELQRELKPEQRAIVADFYLHHRSYEEIAAQRGIAIGSVGVYLKRSLETLRAAAGRQQSLLKELEAHLR